MRHWRNAVLNFAITSVQVGINPALDKDRFSFRTLHDKDGCYTPVMQKYLCPKCDEVAENTVRGIEFPPKSGNFVRITEEEFSSTFPKIRNIINITKFVHEDMVNKMLFLDPYWVVPDSTAMYASQYAAVKAVMLGKHQIGLGTVAFNDKEHAVALEPVEDGLVLWMLSSPDKLRLPDWDLPLPDELSLKLTETIVELMSNPLSDADFEVETKARQQALIDSKQAGVIVVPQVQQEAVAVVNVLDSLKESIALLQKQKKRKNKSAARR